MAGRVRLMVRLLELNRVTNAKPIKVSLGFQEVIGDGCSRSRQESNGHSGGNDKCFSIEPCGPRFRLTVRVHYPVKMPGIAVGGTVGSYEICSLIGKGGMGEVYQATDSRLGRNVAIKVLPQAYADDQDRIARLQREARLLASLNH